jgi:hypothetical protein
VTAHDLVSALLGAAAGLLLQAFGFGFIALREYTRREFAGRIYAILPPSGGKNERIDRMWIRQRGQRIQGNIKRISPPSERGRQWKMTGYTHGNLIVATFSTTAPRLDPSSYGVIVLHRDPKVTDCGVWRGYYVRPDLYGLAAVDSAELTRYPYVWQQLDPGIRNYGRDANVSLPSPEGRVSEISSDDGS